MKAVFSLFRKHRYASSAAAVAVVACGLFLYWSFALFRELETVTSQRTLRRSTVFYSDIVQMVPGMNLSREEFARALRDRGYAAASTGAFRIGRYRDAGIGKVEVFFRHFDFPDGRTVDGRYLFSFRGRTLAGIERSGARGSLPSFPLEPILLGDFSKDGVQYRPWVPLDEIPPFLKTAVLLSEDRRFYYHYGVDLTSLIRAATMNVRRKGIYQGGSTITQQLIKNAFLDRRRTFRRKMTEALLAVAMELRYSKDEILAMYLNQIYLGQAGGRGIYGVQDASLAYFGKQVSDLTLPESALIAGLIPAPVANSPKSSPERARTRRNLVLDVLLQNGVLTAAETEKAKREPIRLAPVYSRGMGNYYIACVNEILKKELGVDSLDGLGYLVFTSMDPALQESADRVLAGQALEGALIAMDPRTGFVRAMAGGRSYAESQYNRALLAFRQPGSAFKPIVYAAALESRLVTLATRVNDEPLVMVDQDEKLWEPQNHDGQFFGTVTVREAIVHSRNIPVIKVFETIGAERVVRLGKALGITSRLKAVPSLALGTSEVTPLQLTVSYAAFANGGFAVRPRFVRSVTDARGKLIRQFETVRTRVISEGTAALVTDALQAAINHGTAYKVREMGFYVPAAGKTGTSDDFMDAWFIGYTPHLLCGVWLGYDRPRSLGMVSSNISVPVWVSFMRDVQGRHPADEFPGSKEIVKVMIDPETEMLAAEGCPGRREEAFLAGTEPTEPCIRHSKKSGGFLHILGGEKK